ncbi:MAG TPA: hypothetical protein VN088_10640 [Nocardioides sp.]|nr:hypothetical protein [Nocardioides sp.]
MKFKRQLAAIGGTLALVTAGASVALVGGLSSSSAAEAPSSAYGLTATGPIPIKKTPTVTSTTGALVSDSLVGLPSNPLLSGGVLNVRAKNGFAHSDVTDLSVIGNGLNGLSSQLSTLTSQLQKICPTVQQIPIGQLTTAVDGATGKIDVSLLGPILNAVAGGTGIDLTGVTAIDLSQLLPTDLSGLCDVLAGTAGVVGADAVTTECHGSTGTVGIANLSALGLPVVVDTTKKNLTVVDIPGVVKVEINRQVTNSDGSFTVDGILIDLPILQKQEIVVTSATCGNVSHRTVPTPTSNAPTPTPTHTRAPVTG